MILNFSLKEKDNINEETIELLEPYIDLKSPDGTIDIFTAKVAAKSNNALSGLCQWCGAMSDYHKASKIVKPKLIMLTIKEGELNEAES